MSKVVIVNLDEIRETFFVRAALDQSHVDYLAELYKTGVDLPPIEIDERTSEMIAGRHRMAALIQIGRVKGPCILRRPKSRIGAILMAFGENVGGPKPPNGSDINHTIETLFNEGATVENIVTGLHNASGLPKRMIRQHITTVRSSQVKRKLTYAVSLVVENGLPLPEAAVKAGVSEKALGNKITSQSERPDKIGVEAIKGGLSTKYRGIGISDAHTMKDLIQMFEDGEIAESVVLGIMDHKTVLLKKAMRAHCEWIKRFDEKRGKGISNASETAALAKPSKRKTSKENERASALSRMGL